MDTLERRMDGTSTRAAQDPATAGTADALDVQARLQRAIDTIPLARSMALTVASHSDEAVTLAAPLLPNINDKGCAFGGSLASALTLAGWALVKRATDARGYSSDIYVQDSAIRYLAPVWQDFTAVAQLAEGASFDAFFRMLADRGKARIRIQCTVPLADGSTAAILQAHFVALATT